MPRHAHYGGHKSRPDGNERDFNDDYHWSDKHAMKPNDWLTTNTQFLLPRVAYPAHRTPVSQGPLFPRRSPNVGVVASRYPIYTTGGLGHGGGPGYEDSEGSVSVKEEDRTKKRTSSRFILCITLVIFFILIAIALAIVAIYLALRDNNTKESYVGTYEAKVRMANRKFTDKLGDVTSDEFKKEQEDFCSKTKTSFDGAVKNCVVDAFGCNGSLVIQSSLDFDLDQLEKLVKEGGSVPGEKTITAAITRVLKVDDDVTVQWVVKEPESRECHVCLLHF
ncbi:hypothetical protein NP493_137g04039 [Ridgeia piscesae]|uniref:SEA domain-containing protein n=1 Tax=Ridgeia piscesae TaxID=27915 RepID=A0AAD9UGC9_RIDPI|nr:hypothetical protein NP493_137g04039 [Ridgeia piscesae]